MLLQRQRMDVGRRTGIQYRSNDSKMGDHQTLRYLRKAEQQPKACKSHCIHYARKKIPLENQEPNSQLTLGLYAKSNQQGQRRPPTELLEVF